VKENTQTNMFGNENLINRKQLLQILTDKQRKYFDPTNNKNKKALALEIRNHKIDILINQLELMVKSEGLEPAPVKANYVSNKKFVEACELYQKTQGWVKTIDKLKYLKQHPEKPFNHFDWKLDFPEVLNPYLVHDKSQRGFDIVIGNPPYIKEYTNRSAFEGIKRTPYYQGKMDIWYGFACTMIDLLKNKGIECFIAQNNWITSTGASIFRNKVLTECEIKIFTDFGNYKVFETAGIQTMIYIFQKSTPRKEYYIKYSVLRNDRINKSELIDFLNFTIPNDYSDKFLFKLNPSTVKGKTFTFNNNISSEILKKIKTKGNLYLTEMEVAQGIVFPQDFVNNKSREMLMKTVEVGNGIFALSQDELNSLNLDSSEKKLIKPYYTTDELDRYYANPKNKLWIIYTGSEFKNPKSMEPYPNLKRHLDKFKDVITSDNKPYGLHRAREEKIFKGESIIAQRKCPSRPSFTYTDFDCYVSATFYVIQTSRINMKYLTGLLNSKLIEYWLRNKGKMQGNNFQIDKEPLLAIPLINADEKITKQIESIVDAILSAKKNNPAADTANLEQQIDHLVNRLYDLTDEEISIVENKNR
ncbi:MAG TPA: Eco57I restriction-modification methylase domain-containing protein, partial [Pseudobacteroides sp.]|nr:Eco57I restriction-modification methylase domain-containing protein [Pseudobacteroides sp.]